jgi:hypothetical protein
MATDWHGDVIIQPRSFVGLDSATNTHGREVCRQFESRFHHVQFTRIVDARILSPHCGWNRRMENSRNDPRIEILDFVESA